MSSVLGLNVSPSNAIVRSRTFPPRAAATLRAIARLRTSLTASTDSTMRSGAALSCAVLILGVLGRHEPPKPGPACRNQASSSLQCQSGEKARVAPLWPKTAAPEGGGDLDHIDGGPEGMPSSGSGAPVNANTEFA